MNNRFLPSNLIDTLRNSVAALADSSPLLPAPMAHWGLEGSLSDRHEPGITCGRGTNKRRLSAGWLV